MKKSLTILVALVLIVTGCNDQKNNVINNDADKLQNVSDTNVNEDNNSNVKEEITEENEDQNNENSIDNNETIENKNENNQSTNTNVSKDESVNQKENNNKTNTNCTGNSNNEQPKQETIEKPQVPTCTAKKFDNTYSYVYTTKEECNLKGNDAFTTVSETRDSSIFSYGCKEIVDNCGTTWYGVYFSRWSEIEGQVVRVYY